MIFCGIWNVKLMGIRYLLELLKGLLRRLISLLEKPRRLPMKDSLLHIRFGSLDELGEQVKKAMLSSKPMPDVGAEIRFEDYNSFMSFLFPHKFSLLVAIKSQKPSSIYQLAKLVGRQQNAVLRDCNELESYGFIIYEPGESRNSKVPKLAFNYSALLVHDERGKQSHSLPAA